MVSFARLLFITGASAVVLLAGPASGGDVKNVLDLYRLLPPALLGGTKFVFEKTGAAWTTKSPITDAVLECTVDLKNGYIEVSDPGTGGGTVTQEVALFITNRGERLLGVSLTEFDGVGVSGRCAFHRWTGKGWTRAAVLPDIPLARFFRPGFDPSAVKDLVSIAYDLPRTGTRVIARLDLTRLRMMSAGEAAGYGPDDAALAKRALSGVAYGSIELLWSMEQGVFTAGKRIR